MFSLLRRRFFSVILVIGILLLTVLGVTYYLIYRTLMNDYTAKTIDFADKVTADMQTRTEYTHYIAELFVKELEQANQDRTESEFATDVNRIRIFNQNIQGAIHFENGQLQNTSASEYIQMFQEIRENDFRRREPFWMIAKTAHFQPFLFLLVPYETEEKHGFFAVDTSGLKKGLISDNLFFEDATLWLSTAEENLCLLGEEERMQTGHGKKEIVLEREIQQGLALNFYFPMRSIYRSLHGVLIWMILLACLFLLLCTVVVKNMVNQLTGELEQLKEEMDAYGKSPVTDYRKGWNK